MKVRMFFAIVALVSLLFGAHRGEAAVLFVAGPDPVAPFAGTVIDFEGQAEGTLISNQYAGVTFGQAPLAGRPQIDVSPFLFAYAPSSGTGVLTGSTEGGYSVPTVAGIVGTFATPVASAGTFFSDTSPLGDYLIQAFGSGGTLLESYTLLASSLPVGTPFNDLGKGVFVGFTFGSDVIYSIQFGPSGASGDAFAIDDFRYAHASAAVPEPGTMLLLGSGLVGLVGYGRRRFKK